MYVHSSSYMVLLGRECGGFLFLIDPSSGPSCPVFPGQRPWVGDTALLAKVAWGGDCRGVLPTPSQVGLSMLPPPHPGICVVGNGGVYKGRATTALGHILF